MNTKKRKLPGERLEADLYDSIMFEHLHRYAIAAELCKNKTVLDIASGEGYGSAIIAAKAKEVIGVDINESAVEDARLKYNHHNLKFMQGSADKIPLTEASLDIVVSFETLEHHDKHDEMMAEIKRVLKPGGLLIISTPDKLVYSDKKNHVNKFHIKELYEPEFKVLLSKYFSNVRMLKQRTFFCSMILDEEQPNQIDFYRGNYNDISKESGMEAEYLFAIASDNDLQQINTSLFIDESFPEKQEKRIKSSTRYQFGEMILNPIHFFKKKFKN